ncbi:MAG: beta-lactamase family protein [Xanthomonadales bacterium]|nr:beta-lactamase family protein [Xanthomonadales bacterium]
MILVIMCFIAFSSVLFSEDINSSSKSGFSKEKLEVLTKYLEKHGSSSMVIVHRGEVVFSWGDVTKKHLIHSIRKSMLNALYGIYVDKGVININSTLKELGIDDIHGLTELEKTATVADLLKSRSGIYHSATAETKGMLAAKPKRGTYQPNEHYYYNNWDFNVAGHIFEKLTGKKIFDAYYEDIARPVGMTEYRGEYTNIRDPKENLNLPQTDGFYQYESHLSYFPAYHFRMSTNDMARFAQLFLNKGKWKEKRIISESWIELSTQAYSVTNEKYHLGYGMLWSVVFNNEKNIPNSFYHTGVGVHMMAVYPNHDMLFIHRVDTEKEYAFQNHNIYPIISMVFDAKSGEK